MTRRQRRDECGVSLTEYAIIIAVIAVVAVGALQLLGDRMEGQFDQASNTMAGVDLSGGGDGPKMQDDFGNMGKWDVVKGKWAVEDGRLVNPKKSNAMIFAKMSGSDYVISLGSAKMLTGNGYGVFFRADGEKKVNGYTFEFDPGYKRKGAFIMREWKNGKSKPFAVSYAPGFDWKDNHEVRIAVKGKQFSALVDGKQVLSGSDDTYGSGTVGLRTRSGTQTSFDNFSVVPIS